MNFCSKPTAITSIGPALSRRLPRLWLLSFTLLSSIARADVNSAMAAMENPANPLFMLSTSRGSIYIEMLPDEAPENTAHLMALAQGEIELTDEANGFTFQPRYYDGMRFHRVIPGFVIQTGSPAYHSLGAPEQLLDNEINAEALGLDQEPLLNSDGSVNARLNLGNQEDFAAAVLAPLYEDMGIESVAQLESRQFAVMDRLQSLTVQQVYELQGYRFDDSLRSRPITRGIVALANRGPGTNGTEFFIALADLPSLTGKYTVVGRVVEGLEVVDQIGSVAIDAQQVSRNSSVIYSFERVNAPANASLEQQ